MSDDAPGAPVRPTPRISAPPSPVRPRNNPPAAERDDSPRQMVAIGSAPDIDESGGRLAGTHSRASLGVSHDASTISLPHSLLETHPSVPSLEGAISTSDLSLLRRGSVTDSRTALLSVPGRPLTPGSSGESPKFETLLLDHSDGTGDFRGARERAESDGWDIKPKRFEDVPEAGEQRQPVPVVKMLFQLAALTVTFAVSSMVMAIPSYAARLSQATIYVANAISWALVQPAPYIYPHAFGRRIYGAFVLIGVVCLDCLLGILCAYYWSPKETPQTTASTVLAALEETVFTFYIGGCAMIWYYAQQRRNRGRAQYPVRKRHPSELKDEMRLPWGLPPPSRMLQHVATFAIAAAFVGEVMVKTIQNHYNSATRSKLEAIVSPIRLAVYVVTLCVASVLLFITRKRRETYSYSHLLFYVLGISFATYVCSTAIQLALTSLNRTNFDAYLPAVFLGYKLMFTGIFFFTNALTWRMGTRDIELRYMFVFQFIETLYLDGISYVSSSLNGLYFVFVTLRIAQSVAMQLGILRMITDRVGITSSKQIHPVAPTALAIAARIASPTAPTHSTGMLTEAVAALRPDVTEDTGSGTSIINRVLPAAAPAPLPTPLPPPSLRGGATPIGFALTASFSTSSLVSGRVDDEGQEKATPTAAQNLNARILSAAKYVRRPYGDTPTAHALFALQNVLCALLSTLCILVIVASDAYLPHCMITCGVNTRVVYERIAIGTAAYFITAVVTLLATRRKLQAAGIDWRETLAAAVTHLRASAIVIVASSAYVLANFVGGTVSIIRAVNVPV